MNNSKDLTLPKGTLWSFVALQYHTLVLNRVLVVVPEKTYELVLLGTEDGESLRERLAKAVGNQA